MSVNRTVKVWVTGAAGAYVALPDCVAVMEQPPPARIVTVLFERVQADGVVDAKVTARPELADTLRENGAVPAGTFGIDAKDIVCGWSTWIVIVLLVVLGVCGSPP